MQTPLSFILPTTTHRCFIPRSFSLMHRFLSTGSPPIEYPLSHPIYTIWGANTGVGKTLVSTGIAASFLSPQHSHSTKFIYIKPIQTGFPSDSDSHSVYSKFSQIFHHRQSKFSVFASNQNLKVSIPAAKQVLVSGFGVEIKDIGKRESGFWDLGCYEERKLQIELRKEAVRAGEVSELICKTIYGWREAVSPHLAAHRENALLADSVLLEMLKGCLAIGLEGKSNIGEDVSGFLV